MAIELLLEPVRGTCVPSRPDFGLSCRSQGVASLLALSSILRMTDQALNLSESSIRRMISAPFYVSRCPVDPPFHHKPVTIRLTPKREATRLPSLAD